MGKYLLCRTRVLGNFISMDDSASRDTDRFLAVGEITQSDRLVVELIQRPDTPDAILIKWPVRPTVLGAAQIEMAARRAARL